ncbi:cytochrome P450 71A1 [Arachis ipaensis]|uniref:Cytochrome P450 n=1 Tax=Arachis hypogaea TaxID=3818 RepID=A0A6B9V274_ARAHY|nr:cytochrome P450 71A1 [Arachis ipaensis]XP_025657263.1 cytochrome P450 71A1 [Arachis hypogaea]QHN75396.1 Cytochrome P450 [Arachis hypogaea]
MALKELTCPSFELCLLLFSTIITIIVSKLRTSVKVESKGIVNLPPSPRKLAIIGNLHQIGALPYRSFKALSEKYGDVMLLQLGHIPTVVVSSAQVVDEIMKAHDLALSNRGQSTATNILLYGSNDIGFGNYGERWKQKRKICVRELLSPKMVQSESIRLVRKGAVAELVDKVREAAAASCSSLNLSELLVEAANNIICNSALGQKNDAKGVRRRDNVKVLAKKVMFEVGVVTLGDHFPWLRWVDVLTGQVREFKATFAALDPLFDKVIAEHRSSMFNKEAADDDVRDFVDILVQLQDQQQAANNAISNDDIKSILLDMFAAGSETTSVTVEWAMSELMKNPMELKKVQEEVRKVVGHKSIVEESNVNQMEYLKCVVKETLRLHPPAPLLVPRVATRHVKLSGYDIPAKTRLYVNVWAIQRDPRVWDSPEDFIPERHRHSHTPDFKFIPFGFGRRGCPGMNFGLASVEYMLANLLYYFNWESPQAIDMAETFGLVASKRIPLHLKPIPFSFG